MSKGRSLVVSGLSALALFAAACGGGGDDSSSDPQLAGTALPTATAVPFKTPVCDIQAPVPPPANYPLDVVFPPDYVISAVETSPHLRTVGQVKPPPDAEATADGLALLPIQIFENAFILNMRDRWTFRVNGGVDGRDYDFVAADGRVGHFNANIVDACAGVASLTLDFYWITPVITGN